MKQIDPQETIQSCSLRLQAVMNNLKPAEHRAAEFILHHPQETLDSTINELAQKTDTSYATISRLITRIGFSGIKDMKKSLYQDVIHYNPADTLEMMTLYQSTSAKDICKMLYSQMLEMLKNSYELCSPNLIEEAADKILRAKNFCIIGTGLSNICARYAYSYFLRIGINCHFDEDSTHYKMQTSLLDSDDLLMAISSTGRSENILDCARTAKKNQVEIIVLSDFVISPLSQLADIHLFTTLRSTSQFMGMDMPQLTPQMYIINSLYLCCCMKMGSKSTKLFNKTKEATESEKLKNF